MHSGGSIWLLHCIRHGQHRNVESGERQEAVDRTSKRHNWKYIVLILSLLCIIGCFIFASMGYTMKLNNCDGPPKQGEVCRENEKSPMFEQARQFRVAAAVLFIAAMILVVTVLWATKQETDRNRQMSRNQAVLVSAVTAEGLLKTDAPDLPHPHVQVHHTLEEVCQLCADESLPKYETALHCASIGTSKTASLTHSGRTTPDMEIDNDSSTNISVYVQVDEDELNPPPTYLEAIEMDEIGEIGEGENG
ncbi:predicted protein [Nematostella vectensis]|uniref:Uncharacterized protein n=1 Tax=Nematostella vectensis TaxID=45351 RepID=A7T1A8_NEMVE|nr:predicted protein [Nematostella vectensis]|eukprot:XP_001622359.1 hypothetical protein NEMVEDRAFT_v1g248480 [Nematostella vectensis]